MAGTLTHKLLKGETLESVAKKYRLDPKTIWRAVENKTLVSKRGKAEGLLPGDILVLPPSDNDLKKEAQATERLRKMRDADSAMLEALQNEEKRSQGRAQIYESLISENLAFNKKVVGELNGALNATKRWSAGVDVVAQVSQIMVSLTQLCAKGMASSRISGDALEKLNKELTKDVAKLPIGQLQDVGIKVVGELRDRADSPLAYIGIVVNSWEKMTSPSFWANTFVQIRGGKSWSDAVAMDVGDDIRQQIKLFNSGAAARVQKLQLQLASARAEISRSRALIAECKSRIKRCEPQKPIP